MCVCSRVSLTLSFHNTPQSRSHTRALLLWANSECVMWVSYKRLRLVCLSLSEWYDRLTDEPVNFVGPPLPSGKYLTTSINIIRRGYRLYSFTEREGESVTEEQACLHQDTLWGDASLCNIKKLCLCVIVLSSVSKLSASLTHFTHSIQFSLLFGLTELRDSTVRGNLWERENQGPFHNYWKLCLDQEFYYSAPLKY